MPRTPITPGELKVHCTFSKHLGGRFTSAGLEIDFHYNQEPGVHFKADVPPEFREATLKGLHDAMSLRFPQFPQTASIWITRVESDEFASSWDAFYRAARMVVEQAYSLTQPAEP